MNCSDSERVEVRQELLETCPGILNPPYRMDELCPWQRAQPKPPLPPMKRTDKLAYQTHVFLSALARAGLRVMPVEGSLLGVVRHGGMLPKDHDSDLYVPVWANREFFEIQWCPDVFADGRLPIVRRSVMYDLDRDKGTARHAYWNDGKHAQEFRFEALERRQLWTLCGRTATEWFWFARRKLEAIGVPFPAPSRAYGWKALGTHRRPQVDVTVLLGDTLFADYENMYFCRCDWYDVPLICPGRSELNLRVSYSTYWIERQPATTTTVRERDTHRREATQWSQQRLAEHRRKQHKRYQAQQQQQPQQQRQRKK
eukprot:TRINITY_DN67704_c7_g2_i1.p1 TRINITY_DN67704_c7_g2~~TRINITY_DN67704_c7_g2_i1.p1  ORF type:complete len:313 (-),score=92.74 TRINITY_DN67704_c7_g2_i1:2-940(-)